MIVKHTIAIFWMMPAAMACAQTLESGEEGFGWQWVKQHPFVIQAASLDQTTWDFSEYVNMGATVLQWHPENPDSIIDRPAGYEQMPWHGYANYNSPAVAGQTGWIVGDEPSRTTMGTPALIIQNLRQKPDERAKIIYSTALPISASAAQLYGSASQPGYSYSQYLDDFIGILKPDVLMFDHYPKAGNTTSATYLQNLMVIREKAQANNLPYWGWIQAFDAPSESQVRYNVYTHLAAGFTGISYWTYDYFPHTGDGMIDSAGNRTSIYSAVQQLNNEVIQLGRTLRYLRSADVRFVPGSHVEQWGPFTWDTANATPTGLANWNTGAGSDPYLRSVEVGKSQPGREKNGMIGLFNDHRGDSYFMLVNLFSGANLSAEDATLTFTLAFDNDVYSIWLLNRQTGLAEEILLENHVLTWTLPGGTGDLFKYHDGDFAGIVPEPSGLAVLAVGVIGIAGRRRRGNPAVIQDNNSLLRVEHS